MKLPQEQYNEEMLKRFQHEAGKEFLPQITYQAWLESSLSKLTEENATLRAEIERLKTLLHQVHHTLYWHGKVDVDTDLHHRIAKELEINQRVP